MSALDNCSHRTWRIDWRLKARTIAVARGVCPSIHLSLHRTRAVWRVTSFRV